MPQKRGYNICQMSKKKKNRKDKKKQKDKNVNAKLSNTANA